MPSMEGHWFGDARPTTRMSLTRTTRLLLRYFLQICLDMLLFNDSTLYVGVLAALHCRRSWSRHATSICVIMGNRLATDIVLEALHLAL